MPGQFRPQMFEEKKETSEDWVLDPVVQGILFSWIVSNSVVKIVRLEWFEFTFFRVNVKIILDQILFYHVKTYFLENLRPRA